MSEIIGFQCGKISWRNARKIHMKKATAVKIATMLRRRARKNRRPLGQAGKNSGMIAALPGFQLKSGFAVAEFGPNLVVAANRIPDEKSGDGNKN